VRIRDGAGPAPALDTASALFGLAGVRVTEVEREAGERITVWAVADGVPECPGRGTVAEHVDRLRGDHRRDERRLREPE